MDNVHKIEYIEIEWPQSKRVLRNCEQLFEKIVLVLGCSKHFFIKYLLDVLKKIYNKSKKLSVVLILF
jgi:hypothetical protein